MKFKLDVEERIIIHHTVIVEADDEESLEMLIDDTYQEAFSIDDIVETIEDYGFKAELKERKRLIDKDGFEVNSQGEFAEQI